MRFVALIAAAVMVVGSPTHVSNASDMPPPEVTKAQLDREAKFHLVKNELGPKLTKATPQEIIAVSWVIVDECIMHGIDPLFVIAVIEGESNYDIEAISPTGSLGLMQLQPATFRLVSSAKRMLDPVENVRAGIRYIARIYKEYRFRDPETYLFAYNQGPQAVIDHYRNGVPMADEAQSYIPTIMTKYRKLLVKHGQKPKDAKKLFLAVR